MSHVKQIENMIPEPLYESIYLPTTKVCLICGIHPAKSVLYSSTFGKPIIPICKDCSFGWNFYGYYILKKIKPKRLFWHLVKYKLFHLFRKPSFIDIYRDVNTMLEWSLKMKRLLRKDSQ